MLGTSDIMVTSIQNIWVIIAKIKARITKTHKFDKLVGQRFRGSIVELSILLLGIQ